MIEHGKPVRFGTNGRKGIVVRDMEPVVVDLDKDNVEEKDLVVHNVQAVSPALAEMLAALTPPDFPMALGVFRDVERPIYEELLTEQVMQSVARRGQGNLHDLLNAGTTWEVE